MNKMDERIIVVDRDALFENETLTFQGVSTDSGVIANVLSALEHSFEVRRGDAEENTDWKQPIPYVIVKRGDSVFMYKRLRAGGETRLHDSLSIGVGGHMNPVNGGEWSQILINNMYRELYEELDIDGLLYSTPKVVGIINDDSNDVGKVHIGLLVVVELHENSEVSVRETDQLEGSWVTVEELKDFLIFDRLENWSKIAAEIL